MLRSAVILLSFFALVTSGFAQSVTIPEHPLATLRAAHPRLIATDADVTRIHEVIRTDPFAAELYSKLKQEADEILGQPPVVHRLIGPRLLNQSRLCLQRIYTLSLVYRLSHETKYRDRALEEMRAAAQFADWNPSHFLDVAEMTHALAIGYDWLYSDLSPADRALFRRAIVEKGINEGVKVYQKHDSWAVKTNNWNQVCNGGMSLGALAIADEDPVLAEYVIKQAATSVQLAMRSYVPDGGWIEGPGYWHYATRYAVYYMAGLQSAVGTDFGLSSLPGFDHAGDFRIYFQGPTGTFDYADADDKAQPAAEMFWLAKRFDQPVYAWDELRHLRANQPPHALDLIWYQAKGADPMSAHWPLDRMFAGVNVAFLRSSWTAPDAVWLAAKGGNNKANHSHLDLGSFVLDAHGVRWALDLGRDDYNLPGYFGAQRYSYFRLRAESHNTVLIDGQNQDNEAQAPMTMKDGVVTIDLRAAYPEKVSRLSRHIEMKPDKTVVIRDELDAPQPVHAEWRMLTDAKITLQGRSAELTHGPAKLHVRITSPADAVFAVVSAHQAAPQDPNDGVNALVVRLRGKVTNARIEVELK